MKKTAALAMAGILTLVSGSAAFAEETTYREFDLSMIDEDVYEGTWVTAFDTFNLYLPSDWNVLLNASLEEEIENHVYFSAASEDQTESVSLSCAPSNLKSIEEVAEAYSKQEGFSDIEICIVNDIPVVSYTFATDTIWTVGVVAISTQGTLYNATVGSLSFLQEEFSPSARNIMLSFSAAETE